MENLPDASFMFNVTKWRPTIKDLKTYLYQVVFSDLGLASTTVELMERMHGGHDTDTIDRLSMEELRNVLQGDPDNRILPEAVYMFAQGREDQGATPGLVCERSETLFTGIMGVSFDRGGLIVMQSFCSQVYTLHDSQGRCLLDHCHDLELGLDGQVLLRPSRANGVWHWMVHDGQELRERDLTGTTLTIDDFPSIHGRDIIPAMLDAPSEIRSYYPSVIFEQREDVITALLQDANAFRVLREHYCADEDLAIHAVRSNNLAFSLLSEELRNDEPFLRRLAGSVPGLDLHYLLVNRPRDRRLVEYTPDVGTNDQVSDLPF